MENDGIVPTWSGQQGPDAGAWLPACEVEDACTDLLVSSLRLSSLQTLLRTLDWRI